MKNLLLNISLFFLSLTAFSTNPNNQIVNALFAGGSDATGVTFNNVKIDTTNENSCLHTPDSRVQGDTQELTVDGKNLGPQEINHTPPNYQPPKPFYPPKPASTPKPNAFLAQTPKTIRTPVEDGEVISFSSTHIETKNFYVKLDGNALTISFPKAKKKGSDDISPLEILPSSAKNVTETFSIFKFEENAQIEIFFPNTSSEMTKNPAHSLLLLFSSPYPGIYPQIQFTIGFNPILGEKGLSYEQGQGYEACSVNVAQTQGKFSNDVDNFSQAIFLVTFDGITLVKAETSTTTTSISYH